jgi:AraC-like DNA-binding protein
MTTIYEQIQSAIELIESNLGGNLRCEEIASTCSMSERSFHNYFGCVTGFSFKQYLIKRRLSRALELLSEGSLQVVEIALESGYETHESFTRAFRKEFGVAPVDVRNDPRTRAGLRATEKLQLVKEMYMGVLVKKLPAMQALSFSGFAPGPEDKAFAKMFAWLSEKGLDAAPRRVFGHNIDRAGNWSSDPQNEGYKVLLCLEDMRGIDTDGATCETVDAGSFVVTGIEGTCENDPAGAWITAGWRRLADMVKEKNYRTKPSGRWFEEHLEASRAGYMRLDLYSEIE